MNKYSNHRDKTKRPPIKNLSAHYETCIQKSFLTRRDQDILRLLKNLRCLRIDQIETLFFKENPLTKEKNKNSAFLAQRRMKKLFEAYFVNRFFYETTDGITQSYYVLDKLGARFLLETENLEKEEVQWVQQINQRSVAFYDHTAQIADLYLRFLEDTKESEVELDCFTGEKENRFSFVYGKQEFFLNPDGYVRYYKGMDGNHAFLELDKNTMRSKRQLYEKYLRYKAYYASDTYLKDGFETFPMVWFIAPNERRKEKLREWLEEMNQTDIQFHFMTKEECSLLSPYLTE